MNKYIKNFAIISTIIMGSMNFSQAAEFIDGLEDIPIADDFVQIENDDVSFGNEESRFIETYISSDKSSFNEVKIFYINTLPQMGWGILKNNAKLISFERESEVLEIAKESDKPLLVRITLKSKG